MGLQSQLSDVASDSIPFFLLALVATAIGHLCSTLFDACRFIGLHRGQQPSDAVSHHLSLNTGASICCQLPGGEEVDCVFCLCSLRAGDRVRRLECRHVFHKDCLDGWIGEMKFHCPLCRSPLASRWRVVPTQRRVPAWFVVW